MATEIEFNEFNFRERANIAQVLVSAAEASKNALVDPDNIQQIKYWDNFPSLNLSSDPKVRAKQVDILNKGYKKYTKVITKGGFNKEQAAKEMHEAFPILRAGEIEVITREQWDIAFPYLRHVVPVTNNVDISIKEDDTQPAGIPALTEA